MSYDPSDNRPYFGRQYCPNCEEEVDLVEEDWGIGKYEFWGAVGTHHDYVLCCPGCGEELEPR